MVIYSSRHAQWVRGVIAGPVLGGIWLAETRGRKAEA
jgi:hypothetical protein